MKKPLWIFVGISCAFLCLLIGIFLGRNLNNDYISANHESDSQSQSGENANQTNDGRVDINTATLKQLDLLPGIGETIAQRIIDYRNEHGDFASIDDLLNVTGIGMSKLEEIRPYIKVVN